MTTRPEFPAFPCRHPRSGFVCLGNTELCFDQTPGFALSRWFKPDSQWHFFLYLAINRKRDGVVNAGAVSEGATVFSESTSSAVQPHGGGRSHGIANSTKIPSPRIDLGGQPTDPGWRGKEGTASGIKNNEGAQSLGKKTITFFPLAPHDSRQARDANGRSGNPAIGGRQGDRTHSTDQAGDRDARGEVTRD